MKTYSPKPEHIERRWYVLDAGEQVLGRVASEAAVILRGKHKPIFAPHMDVGDNLIIINAAKVVLTGGKETKKIAWRHSGHPGGITGTLYEDLLAKRPAFVVEKAVRGMLPKNRLGRAMIKKLHVVPGPEHPHQAQKPDGLDDGDAARLGWPPCPARLRSRTGRRAGREAPPTDRRPLTTASRPRSPSREDHGEVGPIEDDREEADGHQEAGREGRPRGSRAQPRSPPRGRPTAKKPAAKATAKKKET